MRGGFTSAASDLEGGNILCGNLNTLLTSSESRVLDESNCWKQMVERVSL